MGACVAAQEVIIKEKPVTSGTNPTHYGDPSGGCMSDEVSAQIQGIEGDACIPKCTSSGGCPTDVPEGTTAAPTCAIQDASGDKYCALFCKGLSSGKCPESAKCESIQVVYGLCMYPASAANPFL